MKKASISEAKNNLSALIDHVKGEVWDSSAIVPLIIGESLTDDGS